VLDLGLVGRMGDAASPPRGAQSMTVGTVEYLSPEQARGRADLDARADLYSLGMTLYHMVVGEVGDGWRVVMTLSAFEHSTTSIFSIERAYQDLLEYCRTETRDGRPLIEQPEVRQELADLDARIQAGKATHYRNVSKRSATGAPGPEGSMDIVVSDDLRVDLHDTAMNVLGPEAALWEDGPEGGDRATDYVGAYGAWIAAGTGDVQRNIIGERVLGLPKDDKSKTSHRE